MRKKNVQNTENKKEEIMQQAFRLMAKKGIKEISMREIADACGVTKPVLYYYFKDKEDLCFKLITEKMDKANDELDAYVKSGASFKDILVFIFSSYVFSLGKKKEQDDFFLHLHSFAMSNPRFLKRMEDFRKKSFKIFRGILDEQCKKGCIKKEVKEIGLHFILANIAHLIMHRDCTDIKFGPHFDRDMAQMILDALQYKGENNK